MHYKVVLKDGKYTKKFVLDWYEKLAFVFLILADVYFLWKLLQFYVG